MDQVQLQTILPVVKPTVSWKGFLFSAKNLHAIFKKSCLIFSNAVQKKKRISFQYRHIYWWNRSIIHIPKKESPAFRIKKKTVILIRRVVITLFTLQIYHPNSLVRCFFFSKIPVINNSPTEITNLHLTLFFFFFFFYFAVIFNIINTFAPFEKVSPSEETLI